MDQRTIADIFERLACDAVELQRFLDRVHEDDAGDFLHRTRSIRAELAEALGEDCAALVPPRLALTSQEIELAVMLRRERSREGELLRADVVNLGYCARHAEAASRALRLQLEIRPIPAPDARRVRET